MAVGLAKGNLKVFIFGERACLGVQVISFLFLFLLNDNANKTSIGDIRLSLELIGTPTTKGGASPKFKDQYHRAIFYSFVFKDKMKMHLPVNWLAKISVGGAFFTKTLRSKTIKPNRLKIKNKIRRLRWCVRW